MNLAAPFIRRPVATTLLAAALLLIGIVAYVLLPVAALPNVDFPTLQISASLPGASPETMASNVATPLERQFSLIPGISQMTSVNSLGTTSITLQFELSQDPSPSDFEQVQAAINAASAQLPSNLPAQPTIREVNPSDAPIMILSLNSDTLPLDQVDNYADVIISQQVSRIDGVGLVTIGGQQKPAVRIQLDPRKIAARGLQIDNIRASIVASTTNAPKGSIVGPQRASPSMPTTRSSTPARGTTSSSAIRTARPCASATSERRYRAWRTTRSAPGCFRAGAIPIRR